MLSASSVKGKPLEQYSRLKALHLRWHVKRNLVAPTCSFCQLPTVKNTKQPPQVKSPASLLDEQHELRLKEVAEREKKDAIKDQLWKAALAGLSMAEAAPFLRMDLRLLIPIVQQDFGTDWNGLQPEPGLTDFRSLSTEQLRKKREEFTAIIDRQGHFDQPVGQRSPTMTVTSTDLGTETQGSSPVRPVEPPEPTPPELTQPESVAEPTPPPQESEETESVLPTIARPEPGMLVLR